MEYFCMSKNLDLEELKKEYIGKIFTFLTVTDVIREDGIIKFVCNCKCGKLYSSYYKKILSCHTKSCGCYHQSKEKSEKYKQWCKDHPEEVAKRSNKYKQWCDNNKNKLKECGRKHSQFYKDNPEVGKLAGEKYSRWCKEHPNEVKEKTEARSKTLKENPDIQQDINSKLSKYYENNPDKMKRILDSSINSRREIRISSDYSELIKVLHHDYIDSLMKGEIQSDSVIRTRCPMCGKYAEHTFNNVFRLHIANFRNGLPPLCAQCKNTYTSSKTEQEIANYISTFYTGELIRNSREIISPLELDLYYPEKRIAVEFNGDYWHSEKFKDKYYHYNKFISCKEKDITLVSIFEQYWNDNRDKIKEYLLYLFNDKENNLSFNEDFTLMNNNYPLPKFDLNKELIDSYYISNDEVVFTCGYSRISK